MEALQPVQSAGDQKIAHLVAAEIVDEGVPVPLKPLARVSMLVKRRAVEAREAVRIGGKMRRHPIEQHADACIVAAVDEQREFLGRAEQRVRGELAQRL